MDLSLEKFKSQGIIPISNIKWKLTDFYTLCCKSEFHGCAFFITINKSNVNNNLEAIIHLLQRFCDEQEGGFKFDLSWEQLHSFYKSEGYLHSDKSTPISEVDFIKNYKEIIDGMVGYKNFKITKNGTNQQQFNLIIKSKILWIESIANTWNCRQYFLETEKEFIFFDWGTGV